MHPILFTFGPFSIHTYGVMMVAAFLAATTLASHAARRLPAEYRPLEPFRIADFSCAALLGGLLGGRLLFILLHWEEFAQAPLEAFAIWRGGLVWYGGFLGGVAGAWVYARSQRLHFLRVLDFYIPFLALGHAIGRIGCFLNGCCYGRGRLPIQLVEALGLAILYITLRRLQRPQMLRRAGRVFGAYLVLYAALRFLIEFFRGDQAVLWAGLTLQQVISLGILAFGVVMSGYADLSVSRRRR